MLKPLLLMWCPKCRTVFGFTGAMEDYVYCGVCKISRPMQHIVTTHSVLTNGILFGVEDGNA